SSSRLDNKPIIITFLAMEKVILLCTFITWQGGNCLPGYDFFENYSYLCGVYPENRRKKHGVLTRFCNVGQRNGTPDGVTLHKKGKELWQRKNRPKAR
ncbi:MAG: hypothetical protein K2K92_06375, partial [Duncaniella sp.]|nr:hypothetical protein [Duncaniella sp.]